MTSPVGCHFSRLFRFNDVILQEKDQSVEENDFEEKARLIGQVLELQNTLEDLSSKVDNVKEENLRLKSENQVCFLLSNSLIENEIMILMILRCWDSILKI